MYQYKILYIPKQFQRRKISMYTGMLHRNRIGKFYLSISYPIGPPSKLYEDNQAPIKMLLSKIIPFQSRTPKILVTDLHDHHIHKHLDMLDTGSNMQLVYLNSKPHGGQIIRDLTKRSIRTWFYPPPGYDHQNLICLEIFRKPTHCQVYLCDKPEK